MHTRPAGWVVGRHGDFHSLPRGRSGDRPLGELVQDLSRQTSTLIRQEMRLAQAELTEKGRHAGKGAGMFGGAGLVALYGVGALIAAAILGLATVLEPWIAAAAVGAGLLLDRRHPGAHRQEGDRGGQAAEARAGDRERAARRRDREGEGQVMSETAPQQTPEEIRREIERTRRELGETVDALSHKAEREGAGAPQEGEVQEQVSSNPVPLVAVGRRRSCALSAPACAWFGDAERWSGAGGRSLKRTVTEFREDNLTDWAAALTYYSVLAIFPALIVLVSILGLVGESATQPLIDNLGTVAPGPAKEIFTSAIKNLQGDQGAAGVLFVVGLARRAVVGVGLRGARSCAPPTRSTTSPRAGRSGRRCPCASALTLDAAARCSRSSTIAVVLTGGLAQKVGDLVGLGSTAVDRLGHRQVAGAAGGRELHVRAPLLGRAERQAARASAGSARAASSRWSSG